MNTPPSLSLCFQPQEVWAIKLPSFTSDWHHCLPRNETFYTARPSVGYAVIRATLSFALLSKQSGSRSSQGHVVMSPTACHRPFCYHRITYHRERCASSNLIYISFCSFLYFAHLYYFLLLFHYKFFSQPDFQGTAQCFTCSQGL